MWFRRARNFRHAGTRIFRRQFQPVMEIYQTARLQKTGGAQALKTEQEPRCQRKPARRAVGLIGDAVVQAHANIAQLHNRARRNAEPVEQAALGDRAVNFSRWCLGYGQRRDSAGANAPPAASVTAP